MRACAMNETISAAMMAAMGGISISGEIHHMASRNSSTKGRSTSVVRLAEAMKSRTDSKARRLEAKEPTEAGRLSMRRSSTRSMIWALRRTSTRLLAVSTT